MSYNVVKKCHAFISVKYFRVGIITLCGTLTKYFRTIILTCLKYNKCYESGQYYFGLLAIFYIPIQCHILNTAVCFTTNSNLGFDYHNYWRGFLYRGNDSTKEGTLSLTCENAVCGTEQDIKPLETLSWRN